MTFKPGWIPSPSDPRDYQLDTFLSAPQKMRGNIPLGREWDLYWVLDQGATNHCVGFAYAHWGIALPVFSDLDARDGHDIYNLAKQYDGWPDVDGTNLRAGAKAMQELGRLKNYAFTRSVVTIRVWLLSKGPVVMGTNWYEGMMTPDANGFAQLTGAVLGGHAWTILGYSAWRDSFRAANSYGTTWGEKGCFWIHARDVGRLLAEGAEAVTAVELPIPKSIET